MSYGFLEIDHLLASGDPEIGGAAYERLGFTVTPISVIGPLGVANRLVLLRPLSQLVPKQVTGADAGTVYNPVFSPDGRTIAYFTDAGGGTLRKLAVNGGSAVTLCRAEPPLGMTWGPTGIVFGQPTGIFRVPDVGGQPEVLIPIKQGESVQGPQVLDDRDHVL